VGHEGVGNSKWRDWPKTDNRGVWVQIPARAEIWLEMYGLPAPLANSAKNHCQCEDEIVREWIDHPPSILHAKVKKMKSLTLHTHG